MSKIEDDKNIKSRQIQHLCDRLKIFVKSFGYWCPTCRDTNVEIGNVADKVSLAKSVTNISNSSKHIPSPTF